MIQRKGLMTHNKSECVIMALISLCFTFAVDQTRVKLQKKTDYDPDFINANYLPVSDIDLLQPYDMLFI